MVEVIREAGTGRSLVMVYVYRIPEKRTDGFAFGGGVPITFESLDWFGAPFFPPACSPDELRAFIRKKRYFASNEGKLLVLSDRADFTFRM